MEFKEVKFTQGDLFNYIEIPIGYFKYLTKDLPEDEYFRITIGKEFDIPAILHKLYLEIEHGDEEHRLWLKNKIEDFIEVNKY